MTVLELLPDSNKFKRRQYKCLCDCGNEIIVPSSSLTTNHTSSCGCLNSFYNLYIKNFLNKLKIEYIPEYQVYIDNIRCRFDFYLPKYNLMIEYDGEQHFSVAHFSNNNEEKNIQAFEGTRKRDKLKNKYCKDNDTNLLRIPYYEAKNIDSIIINHLQRLSVDGSIQEYATV